jgi:hypothetical protein
MLREMPIWNCASAVGNAKRGTAMAAAINRVRRWWLSFIVDLLAATRLRFGRVALARWFGVADENTKARRLLLWLIVFRKGRWKRVDSGGLLDQYCEAGGEGWIGAR